MTRFSTVFISALWLSGSAYSAGTLTIQDLPSTTEQPNPVCHDGTGTLANCALNAGVEPFRLAPMVKDGSGNVLGTYVGRSLLTGQDIGDVYAGEEFLYAGEIITPQGYRFWLVESNGRHPDSVAEIWYPDTACSGDAYTEWEPYHPIHDIPPGTVRLIEPLHEKFYTPKNATASRVLIKSAKNYDATCAPVPSVYFNVIPFLPNDPAITGIGNDIGTAANPYPLPLVIERP